MALSQPRGVQAGRISLDRPAPVKLACQSCRTSHQKCDGILPLCSRCEKDQKTCDYAPSRRGRAIAHLHKKNAKYSKTRNIADNARASQAEVSGLRTAQVTESRPWPSCESFEETSIVRVDAEQALLASGNNEIPTKSYPAIDVHYMSTFFRHFWPAHPFLVPHQHILSHLDQSNDSGLSAAINFIGSKYCRSDNELSSTLESPRNAQEYPRNGSSVQTLILLAIAHHMTNDRENAKVALETAVRIALDIGLHERGFAIDHGNGDFLTEESWRRTWWELYIIDVIFAALNQEGYFRFQGLHLEVPLPCEEANFSSAGIPPKPKTLNEFDARFYMDDDIRFSSFTYRIAAARALSKIIVASNEQGMRTTALREAELEMENLTLHLPKNMQTCVDREGVVHETAFQAQMIMYAGTIYHHRPQSLLASPSPTYSITCTPNSCTTESPFTHHHMRKTMSAADAICRLITATSAIRSHTPFFICAVAMQAIVHLGVYSMPSWGPSQKLLEQQIKMSIGALRKLGEVWEMADIVRQDVKNVAGALLNVSRSSQGSHLDEHVHPNTVSQSHPGQNQIEARTPINIDGSSQPNDDSWIEEFLAIHTPI